MVTDSTSSDGSEYWIVAYAKISIDKEDGIALQGVYFGGLGETHDEAELIARECVNTIKGGTVLPRILMITDSYKIIDALYDVHDRFESLTNKMREADDIMTREAKK
jgi:hypothetical protein